MCGVLPLMQQVRSVLCGVDFSDHSAQALRCAAAIAARYRADVTAVTVLDPFLIEAAAIAYDMERLAAETRADLTAFVAETLVPRPSETPPAVKVVTGRAPREILRAAEALHADLIVLGTHGLGGVRRVFFGSTTDRVLRDGGFPVLVVPFTPAAGPLNPLARPRTFVAAVALDRDATGLVETAAALARDYETSLTLVHVLGPLQLPPRLQPPAPYSRAGRQARARERLAELATRAAGIVKVTAEVMDGDPADEIARFAGTDSPIITGLGRPRGIGHRPGSTAYRLVCCSQVPVLALPEPAD